MLMLIMAGICIFGIRIGSREDPESPTLPSGFHIEDPSLDGKDFRCPRSDVDHNMVVPGDGMQSEECPFFDGQECAFAYSEEAYCPTRKKRAKKRILGSL